MVQITVSRGRGWTDIGYHEFYPFKLSYFSRKNNKNQVHHLLLVLQYSYLYLNYIFILMWTYCNGRSSIFVFDLMFFYCLLFILSLFVSRASVLFPLQYPMTTTINLSEPLMNIHVPTEINLGLVLTDSGYS